MVSVIVMMRLNGNWFCTGTAASDGGVVILVLLQSKVVLKRVLCCVLGHMKAFMMFLSISYRMRCCRFIAQH